MDFMYNGNWDEYEVGGSALSGRIFIYRVMKALNNNGLLVLGGESGREVILLGNGIGFGHKTGKRMESLGEAKRYELVNRQASALQQVNSIDPVFIGAAGRIIEAAEFAMGPLSHDILIPMADHIALTVSRAGENRGLPGPFKYDIKALFAGEHQAATEGVGIIKELARVSISEDEVGYITLYIRARLPGENVVAAMEVVRLVQDSIRLIEREMDFGLASDTLGYNRLVSHIRYVIARTRKGERANLDMEDYAKKSFPRTYEAADHVYQDMEQRLDVKVAPEERGFLAIHVQRVMQA